MNPQFTKKQYDDFFTTHDVANPLARQQFEKDFAGQGTSSYFNPWEKGFSTDNKPLGVSYPAVANLKESISSSTPVSSIVGSSDSAVQNERDTVASVAGLNVPSVNTESAKKASEDYIKTIEDRATELEKRRQEEVASIEEGFAAQKKSTEGAQERETGTTNVALQRVGGYLGTQISGVAVLTRLAQTHRSELAALESKKFSAIQEANNAVSDKQFELAKLKAQEAKDLDKTINERRNKFFDDTMKVIQEQRMEEQAQETKRQNKFNNSLDVAERSAAVIVEDIQNMTPQESQAYIIGAAKDLGIDPTILAGEVSGIMADRRKLEQQEIATLSAKYPGADIDPTKDTYAEATSKVRGSKEYKLDIAKAESDLANVNSLINQRVRDNAIDYSDPIFKLYSDATGEVISSPTKARAVLGYADTLLSQKEVVSDDFTGPLADNQIRESEAKKTVQDAFIQFRKAKDEELPDSTVWSWLASPEAQDMDDAGKAEEIMSNGKNPEDFGIYP